MNLHVESEVVDGIEELWLTSDSTVIHLSIDVNQGVLRGFSCRLGPGVVVEMGHSRDSRSEHVYPMFCIFAEDENHGVSSRLYCIKRDHEWVIES